MRAPRQGQPLSSAAVNDVETDILEVVLAHVEREWTASAGSGPTEVDTRGLLAALWVSVYDLVDGGMAHREAEGLLRLCALREPERAGIVLKTLITDGVGYSANQIGVDRAALHREFERLGIALRTVPSFRADVDKLTAHSRQTLDQLSRFRSIAGTDGGPVTIARAVPADLGAVADLHSVVVTGDPGAGKSAALYEVARDADAAGRDLLVFAAGSLTAGSLGMLRTELGLDHEIVEVLRHWPGLDAGLLIIDALDAARGEHTQEALLDLIGIANEHAPRWHIVASIRRFDLRYSGALRAIFQASGASVPEEYRSGEFAAITHFNIPPFSDQELAQLVSTAPDLHAVLNSADADLLSLAKVPFNLRLLAELVAAGVAHAELTPITTQLQLLAKYWDHRVLKQSGGDARELFLRKLCEAMIQAHALTIDRSVAQDVEATGVSLAQLLSDRVLAEEETELGVRREVLAFGHHVLFDYAVARLLLGATTNAALDRAVANPELLLFVRPSYDLHLRGLWALDATRQTFWNAASAMAICGDLPAIGLVLAPVLAAEPSKL